MSRDSNTLFERGPMKSLMQLWMAVVDEIGDQVGTCTTRDKKTVASRFEHEGLSFLTITLPNFGKDFEKGLDRGAVASDLFTGFSWRGGLPKFLSGFLQLVFDRESGVLLDNPDEDAIFAVRQLTLMFGKVLVDCSEERTQAAFDGFVRTEKEVAQFENTFAATDYRRLVRVFKLAMGPVLYRVNSRVAEGDVRPKHGPGATAERILGNKKFVITYWHQRLRDALPFQEWITPGWTYEYLLDHVNLLTPEQELPVRVINVPKTLKTPRIIAIEPVVMQYSQQALLEVFLEEQKRDNLLSKFLGFDDQVPNQDLARQGSIDGSLATLDLSEASDRVSNRLVQELLASFPDFAEGVQACRSHRADVPRHGVLNLSKFASMGSALTFPVEAMVFLSIVLLGIEKAHGTLLTVPDLEKLVGRVRIYGDDIIVPVEYVSAVIGELEAFGFVVNTGKSFWTGRFRESCGKDYYGGRDVSIARCRTLIPTRLAHVAELESTVSLRNQLYKLGLWKTAAWLDRRLKVVLNGYYPTVDESSAVLGRFSFLGYETQREHRTLHSPLVKGYRSVAPIPKSHLDGEYALLKFLLKRGEEPYDQRHLERAGRPKSVNLRLGWFAPF